MLENQYPEIVQVMEIIQKETKTGKELKMIGDFLS